MSSRWNWIEASAGTGKTYTIIQTVLNSICRDGIPAERILLVTFTEKATAELKTRIREGLYRHKETLEAETQEYRRTVSALERLSEMTITTIHGFCQKLLSASVLESGLTFDAQIVGAADSWTKRIEVYLRERQKFLDPTRLGYAGFKSSQSLIDTVVEALTTRIFECEKLFPTPKQIQEIERHLSLVLSPHDAVRTTIESLKNSFPNWPQNWKEAFGESNVSSFQGSTVKKGYRLIRELISASSDEDFMSALTDDTIESFSRWQENAEKSYVKKIPVNCTRYERITEACTELLRHLSPSIELYGNELGDRLKMTLRVRILEEIVSDLNRSEGVLWGPNASELTYDLMISRVHELVQNSDSSFCRTARARWDAVLIDEFQDTDQQQWDIFRTCFGVDEIALTLVGDPKQSIYFFRGADVNVYNRAGRFLLERGANAVQLTDNYRSTETLIQELNRIFSKVFPSGTYQDSQKGNKPISAVEGVTSSLNCVDLDGEKGSTSFQQWMAWSRYCVTSAVDLLQGNYRYDGREVQPNDILFLTESNQQSNLVYRWLTEKNVPSVVHTKEGLFASAEALEILYFFKALENPRDPSKAKALLLTRLFPWTTDDLTLSPELVEQVQQSLLDAQPQRRSGQFLLAFRKVVSTFEKDVLDAGGLEHILSSGQGLRSLTNWEHLLELLQERVRDGVVAADRTALYLEKCMEEGGSGDEEIDLRLDRDSQAVRILTIHKSKGLESPIVFFCAGFSSAIPKGEWIVSTKEGTKIVDFFRSEEGKELGRNGLYDESSRLYYVALTRAKSYLVVPAFAPPGSRWERFLQKSELTVNTRASVIHRNDFLKNTPAVRPDREPQKSEPIRKGLLTPHYNPADRFPALESHSGLLRKHFVSQKQSVVLAETQTTRDEESELEAFDSERQLPSGTAFGTLVHDILEQLDYSWFSENREEDRLKARTIVQDICERRRVLVYLSSKQRQALFDLLLQMLTTPFELNQSSFRLSNLSLAETRRELEFHVRFSHSKPVPFTWSGFEERALDGVRTFTVRPGFLTGRIDLVFRWNSRLYILDWKTNRLGPHDRISTVMTHSYYDLQALWYWNALCALCQSHNQREVPGGIVYCFLRGPNGHPEFFFLSPEELERRNAMKPYFGANA